MNPIVEKIIDLARDWVEEEVNETLIKERGGYNPEPLVAEKALRAAIEKAIASSEGALQALAVQPKQEPVEMSPEFTDTARAALLWVLWHHQGGSSPVGQPIRFALGKGAHDRLNDPEIDEAKRWAAQTDATTFEFHKAKPQREWVSLTDVEWMNIVNKNQAWFGMQPDEVAHEVCKLTEAKLREKNGRTK